MPQSACGRGESLIPCAREPLSSDHTSKRPGMEAQRVPHIRLREKAVVFYFGILPVSVHSVCQTCIIYISAN